MVKQWYTNKVPVTLVVGVQTTSPQNIALTARDSKKPNTYYSRRVGEVNGYREFEIIMPQSPPVLDINIYNPAIGNYKNAGDPTFRLIGIKPKLVDTKPIFLSEKDREFIKFAKWFSENASILTAGDKTPHIYRSHKGNFFIDYYKEIKDKKTGEAVNTPARIGHRTGIIEVSKDDFLGYSVPIRMVILLHEYSHKNKNPQNNRPIGYETGADISALEMYLSMGYSPLEAEYAFLNVFKGANNDKNHKRYLIIRDFIHKFKTGQLTQYYKAA